MKRRQLGMIVCAMASGMSLVAFAQQQPAAPSQGNQPRPPNAVLQVPNLPPELERLLKTWEQESAKIETLTGRHERSEFNHVFQVETRTEGKFFFDAPDKGRIDMNGKKLKATDISLRKDEQGNPYRLQSGHSERWICTGQEVLQINDDAKEMDVIPIPKEAQGRNIINTPLPFLFGLKAEEAKKRFQIELLPTKANDYFSLKIIPKTNKDAFRMAYVKLDRQLFVPTAVILFDLAGSLETRYEFSDIKINDNGIAKRVSELYGHDPFHPTLIGYKRVQRPVQPAGAEKPQDEKVPVRPIVNTPNGGSSASRSAITRPPAAPSKTAINR